MRFSILTPTRDRPDWLRSCIASVQAQTFEDFEHVIYDNGTGSVRDLVPDDPRFRYVHGPAAGPADAFQKALDLAQGEIIHPLGDDDRLTPDALATVDAAIGDCEWLNAKTLCEDEQRNQWISGGPVDLERLRNVYYLGGAIYWKRSLTGRVGGFDQAYDGAADFDLYLRFAKHARAVFVDRVLYLYTDHPATDSRVRAANQAQQAGRIAAAWTASKS